jgi:hypothetical protein
LTNQYSHAGQFAPACDQKNQDLYLYLLYQFHLNLYQLLFLFHWCCVGEQFFLV